MADQGKPEANHAARHPTQERAADAGLDDVPGEAGPADDPGHDSTEPAQGSRHVPRSTTMTASDEPASGTRRPALPALQPGMMLEQYQLIRELGRGGMGAVFLARDTRLGRRVAIKFLIHEDGNRAQRFMVEARATARCKHDNIVDIYDIGEALGRSYMVLEYVEGVTLRAWLRERWQPATPADQAADTDIAHASTSPVHAPVSATQAVEIMIPVVRALAHAHDLGLVHRDLKPENILLADNGSIKVLDFGIAKVLDPTGSQPGQDALQDTWPEHGFKTREGAVMGTMPYMAPEQWGAGDIDARCDLWAVGIILWELCTGQHPLAPLSRTRLMTVADAALSMPSMVDAHPHLGALAQVIDRCLAKPRSERMPSARVLLDELESLLHARGAAPRSSSGELENPYVGLVAFQPGDAARFFGRDRDIASLITRLRHRCMVTVVGDSGTGKSSLVRAGVIPALERSGEQWKTFIVRPGRQPMAALADVLVQISQTASEPDASMVEAGAREALIDTLRGQPGYLGTALRAHSHKQRTQILLVVDQFEELYTLGADQDTREAFVACLQGAADDVSSPLRVVLAVRSDFVDRLTEDGSFTSENVRSMIRLARPDRAELRQAVVGPLENAGYAFESESMLDTMLDDLQVTSSPLSILQLIATRLWEARDRERRLIPRTAYRDIGGIQGTLVEHAMVILDSRQYELTQTVLPKLALDQRTRAVVRLDELRARSTHSDQGAVEQLLARLDEARLVCIGTDSSGNATVELTHRALIYWLGLWGNSQRDEKAALFLERLQDAAREWDVHGRSPDFLWRGQKAEDARRWLERWDGGGEHGASGTLADLNTRERDYLRAVVALATRIRGRQQRRRWMIAAIVASLGAIGVIAVALDARRQGNGEQALVVAHVISDSPHHDAPAPAEYRNDHYVRVFSGERDRLSACFDQHAEAIVDLPRLAFKFTIDHSGRVTSADIEPGLDQAAALRTCLLGVARTVNFGPHAEPVEVMIPIEIRR